MSKTWQLSLLFFIFFIILFRFYQTKVRIENGEEVKITGQVLSEPIRYDTSQSLVLENIKFYLPLYPEIFYGDRISVSGFYENKTLKRAKLVSLSEKRNFFFKTREKIIVFFQKTLPEPSASLVAGVTLGSKASIPVKYWEKLKKTGTAHVVVASGMNVSLVASFILSLLLLFLNRRKAIVLTLAAIWLYAAMSGLDAPIIRAAIMGSIAFTAQLFGRLSLAFRSLVMSALIMLLIKPVWLNDLGFILSFVATTALILWQKPIERRLYFVPGVLREGLSTSLAAQIGVAPILFVTFGQFNPLSPLINALVLWTIPYITVLGMVGGLVGVVVPFFGKLVLYLAYPLCLYFNGVISIFS